MDGEAKSVAVFGAPLIARPLWLLHRIGPVAIIGFGLILSMAWTGLLGYWLFELGELAF